MEQQIEKLTIDPFKSKQVCDFASDYVSEEFFPVGERWFVWEEWDDPENDLTAHTASGTSIPGDYSGYYQWSEVYSCEIQDVEVGYNPDAEEYTAKVTASVIILRGDSDDDDDEPTPEIRTIYCCIEADEEGNLCVENAEE